eukprot:scaffold10743_cov58-Attheya_sp.AAC.1
MDDWEWSSQALVKALVKHHGVSVNTFDAQGQTTLFYAAQCRSPNASPDALAVVQYLIHQKSHVVLKNAMGQTVYDEA